LDEKDHSNFNYEINGFSDKYYLDLRKRLDSAEWQAKYMQQPFVREGLLFPVEELRMFEGIIPDDGRESETVAVIDPAFGGGDSLSMPICRDYGHKERYIIDWVFNRGTQSKTVPLIVNKIVQHYITRVQIEKNSGGQLLADSIKQEMERRGVIHCKITLVSAPVKMSKEDKISAYSDFVKEHFIFLIPNQKRSVKDLKEILYKRTSEYQKAIEEMCMYSAQGKQPHDDAPDSIVQLAMFFDRRKNGTIEIPHNPFKAY
jgi:predicted phage terminase large subunit-like protein